MHSWLCSLGVSALGCWSTPLFSLDYCVLRCIQFFHKLDTIPTADSLYQPIGPNHSKSHVQSYSSGYQRFCSDDASLIATAIMSCTTVALFLTRQEQLTDRPQIQQHMHSSAGRPSKKIRGLFAQKGEKKREREEKKERDSKFPECKIPSASKRPECVLGGGYQP